MTLEAIALRSDDPFGGPSQAAGRRDRPNLAGNAAIEPPPEGPAGSDWEASESFCAKIFSPKI
jgi:hypothetical protein